MPAVMGYLVVFLGGGLGAALRHGVNRFSYAISPNFPAGTLCINVLGCLLMGILTGWFALRGEDTTQTSRLMLTTGLLGGFTTFSAFSLDAATLWQRGETANAVLYVTGSVALSLVAIFAGMALMRQILN